MANVLIMPRQGNTVESCVIVRWKAKEGAAVSADEAVCEVETDKASFDVPAGASGVLLKILHAEGDDVPVLAPIAVIGAAGEDWAAAIGAQAPAAAAPSSGAHSAPRSQAPAPLAGSSPASAPAPSAGSVGAKTGVAASPRARRLAAGEGIDATALAGSGPGGRVIERDVVAAISTRPQLTAAARAAALAGAILPAAGHAIGGRAGLSDLATAGARPAMAPMSPAPGATAFTDGHIDSPVKGVRKLIAERISASLRNQAQLSLHSSASAARLQELRARFKASDSSLGLSLVTIGDLVLYAVSRVLPRFPYLNAHFLGETIRSFERVHLGLAVDTPRGLMVPVIRNADLLSLTQISSEAKRLAAACQGGSISPDELSGSSFTVTNLGAFGIESFTPVLNAPEVGILGLCSIVQRPASGQTGGSEPRIGLSLTIDHQAVDGAPGARFLEALAAAIADIDLLLMK